MNTSIRFCILGTILILVSTLTGCASQVQGTPPPQPTRDMVYEKTVEEQLARMDPAAVPIFQHATTAMDTGDYEKALLLYEKVTQMAPGFSTAYRRLGRLEVGVNNNIARAEELLRKAVALEPNAYNRSELAKILLHKGTPAGDQEAFTLASQSVQELPDDETSLMALVMAAGVVNNLDILRQTNEHLLVISPYNSLAHYMAGLLAADDGHWLKAKSELLYSQELGMDADSVQKALAGDISINVSIIYFLLWSGVALAAWLAGLGLLYLLGSLLSQATIRSLSKMEPTIGAQLQPSERRIRSIYRSVIVVLSFYYYISMPFMVLALLFVVGGAFYIFFLLGRIPVQLAIVLVVMVFASLFAILRSILMRRKETLVGRPLSRSEAPALWQLTEEVAKKLDTRPVDSITVTPYAEIAVNEKGGLFKRGSQGRRRNLLLGMGVLSCMDQGQFASILAHEYGHFYNRDTAGGDLAYKVYSRLDQLALGLVRSGTHHAFNPVWLFVMAYQRVFLRVTLGASRLQEVLADRFAAMAFGRENFVEGLKNIVRQTIAFQLHATVEIRKMLATQQTLNNIYQLPLQAELQGELDQRFEAALRRKTSPYDSHPSTSERIEFLSRLRVPYTLDQINQSNPAPVSDLFPNFEELQQDQTARLIQNLHIK